MRVDAFLEDMSLVQSAKSTLKKLQKATQDFEAIFYKDMLKAMRKGVQETEIGDSLGKDIYTDLFDQAVADGIAKTRSNGVAKMLLDKMAPIAIQQERLRVALDKAAASKQETTTEKI